MTVDLVAANEYFATRLNSQAWDAANDADRTKALATAERQLDPHRDRVGAAQFAYAVYEQALWLLAGDERSALQQAGVIQATIGNLSETYQSRRDPAIAPQAWAFLRGPARKAGGLR